MKIIKSLVGSGLILFLNPILLLAQEDKNVYTPIFIYVAILILALIFADFYFCKIKLEISELINSIFANLFSLLFSGLLVFVSYFISNDLFILSIFAIFLVYYSVKFVFYRKKLNLEGNDLASLVKFTIAESVVSLIVTLFMGFVYFIYLEL